MCQRYPQTARAEIASRRRKGGFEGDAGSAHAPTHKSAPGLLSASNGACLALKMLARRITLPRNGGPLITRPNFYRGRAPHAHIMWSPGPCRQRLLTPAPLALNARGKVKRTELEGHRVDLAISPATSKIAKAIRASPSPSKALARMALIICASSSLRFSDFCLVHCLSSRCVAVSSLRMTRSLRCISRWFFTTAAAGLGLVAVLAFVRSAFR